MKRIALKIDVGTYHGTLVGVPALIRSLQLHGACATFFFSLGFDHSGREKKASSLVQYYDFKTRLYGHLLPSPDIGVRCSGILRDASNAGFEVGIHAWNRANWEQKIQAVDNPWVEAEMNKACSRFSEIFSEPAKAHAAAGWRMNRHALRLTQRLGFSYASDCRGNQAFIPVIDGEIIACPRLPTTLPALDELLSLESGLTQEQAADRIIQLSEAIPGDHIFTLRAELEGIKFGSALERLLSAWKNKKYSLVALRDIHSTLNTKMLPRHVVQFADIPGRSGQRMTQGRAFLAG